MACFRCQSEPRDQELRDLDEIAEIFAELNEAGEKNDSPVALHLDQVADFVEDLVSQIVGAFAELHRDVDISEGDRDTLHAAALELVNKIQDDVDAIRADLDSADDLRRLG